MRLVDLNPSDIRLASRMGELGSEIYLMVTATGEEIAIVLSPFDDTVNIDRIEFANGTVWDQAEINAMLNVGPPLSITGTNQDDTLYGYDTNDLMLGLDGNDRLIGYGGADTLIGGKGDDAYYVNSADDVVVELADEGYDTVYSSVSWVLGDNIEALVLQDNADGSRGASIDGVGNALDNVIRGNVGNNRLNGGAGDDTLYGGGGSDTFVFDDGFGHDRIAGGRANNLSRAEFGSGYSIETMRYSIETDSGNLLVSFTDKPDTLVVEQFLDGSGGYALAGFDFADGSSLSAGQIYAKWLTELVANAVPGTINGVPNGGDYPEYLHGTPGNDLIVAGNGGNSLYGGDGNDTLIGGAGNDDMWGEGGSDTYIVEGGGWDTVHMDYTDYLMLWQGVVLDDLSFSWGYFSDELDIFRKGTDDGVRVEGYWPYYYLYGQGIMLSDGTRLDRDTVIAQALKATDGDDLISNLTGEGNVLEGFGGNDTIYGGYGDDTLDGGVGNDLLIGMGGFDTYRFGRGYGQDTVNNTSKTSRNGELQGRIELIDLLPDDVILSKGSDDTLVISIKGSSDTLTILNYLRFLDDPLNNANYSVKEIHFANGISLSADDVLARLSTQIRYGSPDDDWISPGWNDDVIAGEAGNDVIDAGDGDDTILFDYGDGNDTLRAGNGTDTLSFGVTVTPDMLSVVRNGDGYAMLLIDGGAGGSITLDGVYAGDIPGDLERIQFIDAEGRSRIFDFAGWLQANQPALLSATMATPLPFDGVAFELTGSVAPAGGLEAVAYAQTGNLFATPYLPGNTPSDNDDLLYGTPAGDTLDAGGGNDTVLGLGGDDMILGGAGNDLIDGGDGDDFINGGSGDDTIYGGWGADTLTGGSGCDELHGGRGGDTYLYQAGDGETIIDDDHFVIAFADPEMGGPREDIVDAAPNILVFGPGIRPEDLCYTELAGDLVIEFANNPGDRVILRGYRPNLATQTRSVDIIRFADGREIVTQNIEIRGKTEIGGNAGAWLFGTAYADTLIGGDGSDWFYGNGGADQLAGGIGSDTYSIYKEGGTPPVETRIVETWREKDSNRIELTGDVHADDLHLAFDGRDLLLRYTSEGDTVRFIGFDPRDPNMPAPVQEISLPWENISFTFAELLERGVDYGEQNPGCGGDIQAPVTAPDTAEVFEDGQTTAVGNVLDNDSSPEGKALQVADPGVRTGEYGLLTLQADGSYSYTLDNASARVQGLGAGETVTEHFAYLASDGVMQSEGELSITVHGANDAPEAALPLVDLELSKGQTLSWQIPAGSFIDRDANDTLSYAATLANGDALPDWLVFDAQTQTFSGATMDAGKLQLRITATDPSGASASQSFWLDVLADGGPSEPLPPVTAPDTADVVEDGQIIAFGNVLANDHDPEGGALEVADSGIRIGQYGVLSLMPDGTYAYVLDNAMSKVQGLGAGETAIERFGYLASNGQLQSDGELTVTIHGVNDAPELTQSLADVDLAKDQSFSWQIPTGSFTDRDINDTLTYTATQANGKPLPDWLTFDAQTQTFSGSTLGQNGATQVSVTVSDGHGGTVSDSFKISISSGNNGNGNGNDAKQNGNNGVGNGGIPPGQNGNLNSNAANAPGQSGNNGKNNKTQSSAAADPLADFLAGFGSDGQPVDTIALPALTQSNLASWAEEAPDTSTESPDFARCWADLIKALNQLEAERQATPTWSDVNQGANLSALAGLLQGGQSATGGVDAVSLAASGTQLKGFTGLSEGVQRL